MAARSTKSGRGSNKISSTTLAGRQGRDWYLSCLTEISTRLLEGGDLDRTLPEVLGALRVAAGADRCYLFENHHSAGELVARQCYEVCGEGIAPWDGNLDLQEVLWEASGFSRWMELMEEGRPVTGAISGFPASEQPLLENQGIVWLIAIPLKVAGKWHGFIGFDACREGKSWTAAEVALLHMAITVISAAIGREHSEVALRESEERYRDLFENVRDLVQCVGGDGRFVYVNRSWRETLGYDEREVRDLHFIDILRPDQISHCMRVFRGLTYGQEYRDVEIVFRAKGGGEVVVEGNLNVLMDAGKMVHTRGIFRDITERRQVETERSRLAAAVEHSAEATVITDTRGIILYVNPAFERITGFSRAEIVGRTPRILKSGMEESGFYDAMWRAILAGEVWHGRYANRRKDGSIFHVEQTISPIQDPSGDVVNFVAVMRDVTEQAEMEARLRQVQKMEAIGTLAGGIAHDFNNVLSAILGHTELALMDLSDGDKLAESLQEVKSASIRARELIGQILTFARQQEGEHRPVNLASIVREVLKLLRSTLPATIDIEIELGLEIPPVLADPSQLHQLVMNVCVNAGQAMPEGGALRAFLSKVDRSTGTNDLSEGPRVRLAITDTGCGMDEATMARIFEPYFTTRSMGTGTGLGLSMVHGIVKGCGGEIRVESSPGMGTTFEIDLPAYQGKMDAVFADEVPVVIGGDEAILVVDDEPAVAEAYAETLARQGYRVTRRTSAYEAMQLFEEDPGAFDLVISDQTMPQMTGADLSSRFLAIRPDLPIILCTGYSEHLKPERVKKIGVRQIVAKPVQGADLARSVRRILDEAPEESDR